MERRALTPPTGPVVWLSREHLDEVIVASRESSRRRMVLPFHSSPEDRLNRMFNAMQPGSYVRPHRHLAPPTNEVFLVLRGAVDCVVFDETGRLTEAERLEAGSERFGIDLAAGLFHALVVREPDTVIYEAKPGPYTPTSDKDFAPWAPAEGSPEVAAYVERLELAIAAHRYAADH